MSKDHIPGPRAVGLFHIPRVHIVHRDIAGLFAFAVKSRDGSSFVDFVSGQLAPLRKDDYMRTRDILGMKPDVSCRCLFEGQLIVFKVIASGHDFQSGG